MLFVETIDGTIGGIKFPSKAHEGDAGWDVYSRENKILQPGEHHKFNLGFKILGQKGKVYITQARSSFAINHGINVIGNVIDNGYRGEVSVILQNSNSIGEFEIKENDKIAQILVVPVEDDGVLFVDGVIQDEFVNLPSREEKGYGSSGK